VNAERSANIPGAAVRPKERASVSINYQLSTKNYLFWFMSGLQNGSVTAAAKKLDAKLVALAIHATGTEA
jgi:hypothetical protein